MMMKRAIESASMRKALNRINDDDLVLSTQLRESLICASINNEPESIQASLDKKSSLLEFRGQIMEIHLEIFT